MGDYVPTADGAPSDENIPATFSANQVVGDIYPQGADDPFQRVLNTRGGGLFTTNSDPSVVGTDPLTGANAPTGTDVGFSAPARRFMQTGVWNGDFSQGPPDPSAPISADNPLPYWTWTPAGDGLTTLTWRADASYGSGYSLLMSIGTGGSTSSTLRQLVPVPISQGQQYRALLSMYVGSSTLGTLTYQFYKVDGTTAIGSAVSVSNPALSAEVKIDAGLVPPLAGYIVLTVSPGASPTPFGVVFGEVRAAFPPAEATLGLGSISANSAGITTTETSVKNITIRPNTFVVGSVYRITAAGNITSSAANACTFRLRVGTTTLTGAIAASQNPSATTTASGDSFRIDALLTIRSVGAGGTAIGYLAIEGNATQPFSVKGIMQQNTATITVDTTVANLIELTAVAAAGTTTITFRQCVIECLMAS